MGFRKILKKILIYEEPQKEYRFILPETESETDPSKLYSEKEPTANEPLATPPKTGLGEKISKWLRRDKKESPQKEITPNKFKKNIQANLDHIKREFNSPVNQDLIIREFKVRGKTNAFIAYMEGITNQDSIEDFILRPLLSDADQKLAPKTNLINHIANNLLATAQTTIEPDCRQAIRSILSGQTALFVDGYAECILSETIKSEKRAVSTPLEEFIIGGPNEALIEDLRTNITLVRQILRNQNLITEFLTLTDSNNTQCGLLYVKDIINPKIVAEVKRRLQSINFDFISDGILSQLIEDHPNALFPQVLTTERPDRVAGFLMEGKIAILLEGTPMAMIVPVTFFCFFKTSEDYSLRWQYSTFLRLVRLVAAVVAILLPGLYIATVLYHQQVIPVDLLFSAIKSRVNLPFPAALELLLMEVSWELVREAGLRVPGVIGQTLGIVGGVILGQAAVAAGLVSPILIIIVALTGLGAFAMPDFSIAFGMRISRFIFFILGALAGFYGISIGMVILGGYATSMSSFGVPYMNPLAPQVKGESVLFTRPMWQQTKRPDDLNPRKTKRTYSVVRGWKKQDEKGKPK